MNSCNNHGSCLNSHEDSHALGHVVPFKVHFGILLALLVLTVITVQASHIDFGAWNIAIAMLIASVKAFLVGCFFMHLKYENPIILLYVFFPIILLIVMIGGLFIDNPSRYVPGKGSIMVEGFVSEHKPSH